MACRRFFGSFFGRRAMSAVLTAILLPTLVALALSTGLLHQNSDQVADASRIYLSGATLLAAPPYPGEPEAARETSSTAGSGGSASSPAIPTVYAGSPLAPVVMDADLELFANRAQTWNDGKVQMILLDRQMSFTMGTYGFKADKAVVRIETQQRVGQTVRHVWIYLDNARPLKGRGPLQGEAGRLLVTTSTTGRISMLADLLTPAKPENDAFVTQGLDRFTRYAWDASQPVLDLPEGARMVDPSALSQRDKRRAELAKIAQQYRSQLPPQRLAELEREEQRAPLRTPGQGGQGETATVVTDTGSDNGGRSSDRRNMILPTTGAVLFQYDRVAIQPIGEDELALVFMGNVSIIYEPTEGRQGMSLTSSNAVVFVRKPDMGNQLPETRIASAEDVRGVYLEDNVQATNGQFTVRSPRVFYDLSRNKAVILDAVMYAYDARRQLPIYVRAQKLRQESLQSWTAENASLTTSDFAEPTLSLGARQITFTQEFAADGTVSQPFVARDASVRVGKVPLFVWPWIGGDVTTDLPIRDADIGYDSQDGPVITTQWDLFALMGRAQPPGVDLNGRFDYRGDRGPGIGVDFEYDLPRMFGQFNGYLLPYDQGNDNLSSRNDVNHDGDARGYYSWRHRQEIQGGWELSLESSVASDETVLEEFFFDEASSSKPWETSIYLKKQQDDWAFTFLGAYDVNSFAPQTTTLQAPGYRVDKLPELGYYRVGTSFWDNRLTYFSETTVSAMRLRFGSDSPRDRGFNNAQSLLAFGIPNTMSFGSAFLAAGYDSDFHTRFDSRHEIQAPMKLGFIDAVPYVSGRITAYDDDFRNYSGERDNVRFFGTTGVRLHTSFNRAYDDVDSRLFNVHRLRHIIEPVMDINYAGSSFNPENVPVYDDNIEGLQEGASISFGFRNTLQTQRGGQGRWRNVDWLVLNTNFVLRSGDANPAVIPEYYGYRPEYGRGGDHFHTDLMWMVSDTLATVGELVYDFESDQVAYWRMGASMEHTPMLATFVEYSETDSLNSRLLGMGLTYKLTRKWTAGLRYTLDVSEGKARGFDMTMMREMADWRFALKFSHDDIDDRQQVSIVFMPNFTRSRQTMLFGPELAR